MRTALIVPMLMALLLLPGAASGQAAPMAGVVYAGGDGSTIKKAIVIRGARDATEGAAAELDWIRKHLPGATVLSQGRVTGPPHYDVVTVKLADGALKDLHFDITAFHRT